MHSIESYPLILMSVSLQCPRKPSVRLYRALKAYRYVRVHKTVKAKEGPYKAVTKRLINNCLEGRQVGGIGTIIILTVQETRLWLPNSVGDKHHPCLQ